MLDKLSSATTVVISGICTVIGGATINDLSAIIGIITTIVFAVLAIRKSRRESNDSHLRNEKLRLEIIKIKKEQEESHLRNDKLRLEIKRLE